MISRRTFVSRLAQVSALSALPLPEFALAGPPVGQDTIIDAVEIVKYTGPYINVQGVNKQFQVQPTHVYPSLRPPVYQDSSPKPTNGSLTHEYIRIKTKGGLEGFYGHIDPETVTPILKQLRPFLIGKDALGVETLWDQMYRNNRHSRAGHYMMS